MSVFLKFFFYENNLVSKVLKYDKKIVSGDIVTMKKMFYFVRFYYF